MYYLQARYYSPELKRFISVDPEPNNNAYAYVDSNPVTLTDPNGEGKVTIALKMLANSIRSGGKWFAKLLGYLDKDAERWVRKHSRILAHELDYYAKKPSVTIKWVKTHLRKWLIEEWDVSPGIALEIADAVYWVLWVLVNVVL